MAGMGSYFVSNDKNLIALKDNVIQGKKYRFTILTDRLVRLEYSESGVFEDRATQNVIFRNFPKVEYTVNTSETLIQITTKYFVLNYVKNKNFSSGKLTPGSTLKVVLQGSDKSWYYGHPESRNFGTINYSLDDFSGKLKLSKGLYSTDGFAILDDSNSYVLKNDLEFSQRENKELDIYLFMYKKDLGLCFQDYFTLTGYPSLIPRYALGNWWYKNEKYSNDDIINIINKFNENNIPISVFMLGDKWSDNDNGFVFDNKLIDTGKLFSVFKQNNIKFGLTIDPTKKVNGKSYIPLIGNNVNEYLGIILRNLYSQGVSLFNIDYNNPNDRNNLQIFTHFHFIANELMINQRGIALCRNTGFSMHRYPIIFTGKTKVNFETLSIIPFYNSEASNMGLSWIAHPIGGYYGGIEQDELYLRYIQLATFSPIFLLSSEGGEYYKREPWRWNVNLLETVKKFMILRNKLIPYLYTEAYIYHKSGSPLVQPLYYSYPKIYDEPKYRNQYYFGQSMLVIPITKSKNQVMNRVVLQMFIPEGTWYNFLTGKKYPGNKYYLSFYKDEEYPVFCREGSIIPLSLDNTTDNPVNMEIVVFPGKDNEYKLYEDDGITTQYKNNTHYITNMVYKYQKDNYLFQISPLDPHYTIPNNRNYTIRFKNTKSASVSATVNGSPVTPQAFLDRSDLVVVLNNTPTSATVQVVIQGQNIEVEALSLINDDIKGILDDIEIETVVKEKTHEILFSDLTIKKKRIAIRKLKKFKLEPKYINMFLNLLEYISTV